MKERTLKTKLLTALLTLCMVLSLVPISAFAVDSTVSNETELTVTMIHPCEGLSDTGIRRATTAIADSISQHLENELVINKVSPKRQPV